MTVAVLATIIAFSAQSDQSDPSRDALFEVMRELRNSAEANEVERFMGLLNRAVEGIAADQRLGPTERIRALAGIVILSQEMADPTAYLRSEAALLDYAEEAFGPDHELAISSRGRLVTALMQANRLSDAERIAASGPTSPDGRSIFKALKAQRLIGDGKYLEAAGILEAELDDDIRRNGVDYPDRASLLMLIADAYLRAGRPDFAHDRLAPAYKWNADGLYDPLTSAHIALSYGRALSESGQHDHAKQILSMALAQAERHLGPKHRTSLAIGLVLANAHGHAGEFWRYQELRLRHFRSARDADLSPIELAVTLENHAQLLVDLGQATQAESVLHELIALSARATDIDPLVTARAFQELGSIALKRQSLEEARGLFKQAVELFETILGADDLLTLRAKTDLIKVPTRNLAFSEEELQFFSKLSDGPAHAVSDEAPSALVRSLLHRLQNGERLFEQRFTAADIEVLFAWADAEAKASPSMTLEAILARRDLARYLEKAKRFDEALDQTDMAKDAFGSAANEAAILGFESLFETRARILIGLSRHDEALMDLETAFAFAQDARRWIDVSGAAPFETVRHDLFGQSGWHFADAAWHLAKTKEPERAETLLTDAFWAVQVSGLGDASRALARSHGRVMRQDPETAAAIEHYETAVLDASKNFALRVETSSGALSAASLDQADARLRAVAPDYFDHLSPSPVRLEEVQNTLSEHEALVLIAPAGGDGLDNRDPQGLVFAVTRNAKAWARIPVSTRELALDFARFHRELDQRDPYTMASMVRAPVDPNAPTSASGRGLFDVELAHGLYMDLFGNPEISAVLRNASHWLLVPQNVSMSLPYAALVSEMPSALPETANDLRQTRFLGLDKALSVVPDVRALFEQRNSRKNTISGKTGSQLSYVAFGDPSFSGLATEELRSADDVFVAASNRALAVGRLPRLPGTRAEVDQIAGHFDTSERVVLTGPLASELSLERLDQSGALERVNILHFATHGLLAGSFSDLTEPALALSPPSSGQVTSRVGGLNDGLLTASEISRMRLFVDLVVLSACDTSGSVNFRSSFDGLTGLVRAFLLAGAQNLMVSHWRVEDRVAARLTSRTIESAFQGVPRAEALRRAMRDVASDTSRDGTALPLSHPTVWAPFFLVGVQ